MSLVIDPDQAAQLASAQQTFDTLDEEALWQDGFALGYLTGVGTMRKRVDVLTSLRRPELHANGVSVSI
jgi:hypothetical protein